MNRKIRKPIKRNARGLREGVNTFKKRHLLREAPYGEGAWTEECDDWDEAFDKLQTLMEPEDHQQLIRFYNEHENVVDVILQDVLGFGSYKITPELLKWVIESVHDGEIWWSEIDDVQDFFDTCNFDMKEFPDYFDLEGWFDDYLVGNIGDDKPYKVYEDLSDNYVAIDEDSLLRDVDRIVG